MKKEVTQLRVILEGLEAKKQERSWLAHKESGDFDDRKLIEGNMNRCKNTDKGKKRRGR